MRYKVINLLFRDENDATFTIVSVFDDFEGVIRKVVGDLNSLWKGIVPLPVMFRIEEHTEDWDGVKIINDGKIVGENPSNLASENLFEVWGGEMQKLINSGYFKDHPNTETKIRNLFESLRGDKE